MADDKKDRDLRRLEEQHQVSEMIRRATKLLLEDLMTEIKEINEQMESIQLSQADLRKELSEKNKQYASLELKLKSTQEQFDYFNQLLHGDKRQKVKSKTSKAKSDNTDSDR